MTTPIRYYGGKANLADVIIPMIPEHKIYCELFAGGASIFFAKKPSKIEHLNDINGNISNFYRVMSTNFDLLNIEIENTLHDEFKQKEAQKIFFSSEYIDPIKRAWAVWTLSALSFASDFSSGFQFVKNKTDNWHPAVKTKNKRDLFKILKKRLELVTIHNKDANELILKLDSPETCFYLDPPYPGKRQGHYSGYTHKHFNELLEILENIAGSFILSSFKTDYLNEMTIKNNWNKKEIEQRSIVSGKKLKKTELLTFNFPEMCYKQQNLF